jgi:hypothetical protein
MNAFRLRTKQKVNAEDTEGREKGDVIQEPGLKKFFF